MRRLETQALVGFNDALIDSPLEFLVERPDGTTVEYTDVIRNTPAITSSYDGYDNPQLSLADQTTLPEWDEAQHFPVGRLDQIHGRNLEVLGRVSIIDGFQNHYQSLCIKGTDFSNPYIFESATAERDFIIHGLQESLVMERIIRASKHLRENGVGTEYICGLAAPEQFPLGAREKLTTLSEFLEYMASDYATEVEVEGKSPLEVKLEMIERFADCDYLASYRGMDTPYRFGELKEDAKFEEFATHLLNNNDQPLLEEYFAENGQLHYIMRDFADTFATNVAKMHKAGIVHGFLHANNITALGSIVDTDSCKGEPLGLGDEPVTETQQIRDVLESIATIREVVGDITIEGPSWTQRMLCRQEALYVSSILFLMSYLDERFEHPPEKIAFLSAAITKENKGQQQKEGTHTCEFATIIFGVAHGILRNAQENEETVPHIEIPSGPIDLSNLKRGDTFLGTIPPRFLAENKHLVLDPNYTMNTRIKEIEDSEATVYHPLKYMVSDVVLRTFFKHIPSTVREEHPAEFLATVGAGIGRTDPADDHIYAAENQAKTGQYFAQLTETVLDRLGTEADVLTLPKLEELIGDNAKLRSQIAHLDFYTNEPTPIIYLEGDEEYAAFFEQLRLGAGSEIHFGNNVEDIPGDLADSFLIADYRLAEQLAEEHEGKTVQGVLFGSTLGTTPTAIVTNLSSEKPLVTILNYRKNNYSRFCNYLNQLLSSAPLHV